MSNQKWYHKASVQQAIVNGIPAICTAIIAIISLCVSISNSDKQLELSKEQYHRDSINSIMQLQLIAKQNDIANKSYVIDSTTGWEQLQIAKSQLSAMVIESKTKRTTSWIRLANTVGKILDLSPKRGYKFVNELTIPERIKLVDTLGILLNSEINNPALIANKLCLGYWMDAMNLVRWLHDKDYQDLYLSDKYNIFESRTSKIWNDIVGVHLILILGSKDEPYFLGRGFSGTDTSLQEVREVLQSISHKK